MIAWNQSDLLSKTTYPEKTKRAVTAAIVSDTGSCGTCEVENCRVRSVLLQGVPTFFVQGEDCAFRKRLNRISQSYGLAVRRLFTSYKRILLRNEYDEGNNRQKPPIIELPCAPEDF